MAKKISQVQKRMQQSLKRRVNNRSKKTINKTNRKTLTHALQGNQQELIIPSFQSLQSSLDRSARLGVIHKNKAARLKSAFAHQIKKHAAALENEQRAI
jgi:small subunit ribosomal protein S20